MMNNLTVHEYSENQPAPYVTCKVIEVGDDEWARFFFSSDESLLVYVSADMKSVSLWNLETGSLTKKIACELKKVGEVDLSPDGNLLAAIELGQISLRDCGTGLIVTQLPVTIAGSECTVRFLNSTLIACVTESAIEIWDIQRCRSVAKRHYAERRIVASYGRSTGQLLAHTVSYGTEFCKYELIDPLIDMPIISIDISDDLAAIFSSRNRYCLFRGIDALDRYWIIDCDQLQGSRISKDSIEMFGCALGGLAFSISQIFDIEFDLPPYRNYRVAIHNPSRNSLFSWPLGEVPPLVTMNDSSNVFAISQNQSHAKVDRIWFVSADNLRIISQSSGFPSVSPYRKISQSGKWCAALVTQEDIGLMCSPHPAGSVCLVKIMSDSTTQTLHRNNH
ncbi:WD40 repeat domain-containing protein [Zavarzinella formosa]|uniref:WD40 repeat domain-containing protein n=1 Tax=Zavarzinella formosa TaxID=360055 RepID=UPI0002F414F5|nr:WD40 repeat domain-containing protein [Zavarzinella formosa]